MKRFIISTLSCVISITKMFAYEASGRGYDPCAPDIGLPSGSEVGTGLVIALIAIPIGTLILKLSQDKDSSEFAPIGYIGLLLVGGGCICLLPLVAWIFAIGSVIMGICIAAVVIFGIIALLCSRGK